MTQDEVIKLVREKANEAQQFYGDYASMHEAYGVLAEEVAELFDAVRMRQTESNAGRRIAMRDEAIDVAAVAIRIAMQAMTVTR